MSVVGIFAKLGSVARSLPVLGVIGGLVLLAPDGAAKRASAKRAASTEHPLATKAALTILAKGGNAVDAISAAALMAGVVNPTSSGIGGGGFALVHRPGDAEPFVLDFRETAPRAFDPEAFTRALEAPRIAPELRGQLVGTPGEVAGLFELVRRFGKLRWAEIVRPAEDSARRGFAVGEHLARALAQGQEGLVRDASLAALFFPAGRPALAGAVVRNPKLAGTLKRIAAEGPPALYDGTIAAELAETVARAGGRLAVTDLRDYRAKERKALRGSWDGAEIFTMPPPSAGGLLLLQTLGTLSKAELGKLGWNTGAHQHLVAESFRASLGDRLSFVGDPDFVKVDTAALLDGARLQERRRRLSLDRTHLPALFVTREQGTHHLNVIDESGMAVALTTTVNRSFGAKLVAPAAGVVLNDQLADFTLAKESAGFGLKNAPNPPRALARPVSSMTPTLVVRSGRVVLAIGGSGGTAIATNVTQLLLGNLVFGKTPEELVKAPRFYTPMEGPPSILLDPGAPSELTEDLELRGERVETMRFQGTGVQIIEFDGTELRAASDPRKFGAAEVR